MTVPLVAALACGAGLIGLIIWTAIWERHEGAAAQKAADTQTALDGANARIKVDAEVAALSDAAVADDLRKQRTL